MAQIPPDWYGLYGRSQGGLRRLAQVHRSREFCCDRFLLRADLLRTAQGTANVRVADLSIMPLHVSAHVQTMAYAIGEKTASMILADSA